MTLSADAPPRTTTAASDATHRGVGSLSQLLAGYQLFRTSDPQRAEREIGELVAPHRLRVHGDGSTFDATASVASFGNVSLGLFRPGAEVTIDGPPQHQSIAVLLPLTGAIEIAHQGQEFTVVAGGTYAALSESHHTRMRWSADCTVAFLRIDIEALHSLVTRSLPDAGVEPFRFAPRVESADSRAALLGTIRLLTSSLTSDGLPPPPAAQRHLGQHAQTTVLFGLEHNYSAALRDPGPLISNRIVRQAIDLINAESTEQLTVVGVAREVGIGLRALEIGFRKHIEMSPSQYLKKTRLQRAYHHLLGADVSDGVTVGAVAMDLGFTHAGRFSKAYRAEFGESPAATLRRRPQ